MGRFINGINGPIVGKVGTVIGSSRNGVPYVKGPYKKRTKRISKQEKANREKFAMAQHWLRPLLGFVREGFKGFSEKSKGFVAAKSWLLLNAVEGVGADSTINPALAKLSHGDLPLSNNIAVSKIAPNQLQFTWDPAYIGGTHGQDQVMMLAYDVKNNQAFFTTTGQFRSTGVDVLYIESGTGKKYHLYAAFTAADRSRQSDSVYLGEW